MSSNPFLRVSVRNRLRAHLLLLAQALALVLTAALSPACGSTPPELLTHEDEDDEAPVRPPPQGFAQDATWEETLGPGDLLRVNVFDHPQLSSPAYSQGVNATPIQGNGMIQLPLVGEIGVLGRTPSEVRELVQTALLPYLKSPRVDVAVIEFASKRVFLFGAVEEPGAYPLSRPTNVLEVISLGGGFDQFANREQVAWLRAGVEEDPLVLINAEEIDLLLSSLVSPGDLVYVGRRDWADIAEAARDVLPILQSISIPLSLGFQAATLERLR